jgi:hypothetical protein
LFLHESEYTFVDLPASIKKDEGETIGAQGVWNVTDVKNLNADADWIVR